jgi:integrase
MFAAWKMSLRKQDYSPESINHYLSAVRSMFVFAEETGAIVKSPKLRRVKNESTQKAGSAEKPLYCPEQISSLLEQADVQLRVMLLLGLNCGFGPKDLQDLTWDHILEDRITLPRSKTGVTQTFLLWPETRQALENIRKERAAVIERLEKRGRERSDEGHIFVTRFWKLWNKDSIAEQFRKLCDKSGVPCFGIYRLRHCASTAMSLVATPHVHRRFMRHAQLQQQVTYTHIPDGEVDIAVMKTKERLLGKNNTTSGQEKSPEQVEIA